MKQLLAFLCFVLIWVNNTIAQNPVITTTTGHLTKITPPLRNTAYFQSHIQDIKVRNDKGIIGEEEEMEEGPDLPKFPVTRAYKDIVLQKKIFHRDRNAFQTSVTANSFNGIGYTYVSPADPSVAVGPNHIIQMINGGSGALFTILNKNGDVLVQPTYLDHITGKGGLGDPIVKYDQLADRFMMTEFVNKAETGDQGLSIAISQTNDPTGQWYVYYFSTGTMFPDYPKFSIWPDAYYAKTNDFNSSNYYSGSTVYAFDRAKMLAGNPLASMQKFSIGGSYRDFSAVPVTLEGTNLPAAGTGGLFAYMQDNSWTAPSVDSIGLMEFHVDFSNPANSSVTNSASLVVADNTPDICATNRGQCISQPASAIMLEALDLRIMNQPVYRNFGNYEGIVLSHICDRGGNISGLRWYELTKTTANWGVYQQSTFSPDSTHRFMPAIGYDASGSIALAYNVSGNSVYPGIRFTGRKQCDSLNMMTTPESSIIEGTASNKNSRFGDYNQIVCDPDGHTFWFTGMYNVSQNWSTRIASFTLDSCTVKCGDASALTSSNITTSSATISWTGVPNAVSYTVDYKPSGSSSWQNVANATTLLSINLINLSPGSGYDWRVSVNCLAGSGNFINASFSTLEVCNPASGLLSSNITESTATLSWDVVSNTISYTVDYKLHAASDWINAINNTSATSDTLTGLIPGSLYDWRVTTNCASAVSNFSMGQFTTQASCNPPSGLQSSNITSTGAAVSWEAVPGASSYAVEYKASTSSTWLTASAGTTSLSVYLTLSAGTTYNWRVKTNCPGLISAYSTAQLTTLTGISCSAPSSLASSLITMTSATVSWGSINGAASYSLDYKISTSTAWINLASATTTRSFNITGLAAGTQYNWRVRTKCTSGSGAYASAIFTTLQVCNAPGNLVVYNNTPTGAKLSWSGVSGGASYAIDYKKTSTTTWTSATTATTSTSFTFSALSAATVYDWRIKTNCTGNASGYVTGQLTTLSICPDQYESNNMLSTAKAIPVNTNIQAQVASSTDLDYYSFSNSSTQPNIRITLSNLPADYDIQLFSPAGVAIASSKNCGTINDVINYNTPVTGIYKVEVFGKNKAYNASACYTLNVQVGSTSFAPEIYGATLEPRSFTLFPVPASNSLSLTFDSYSTFNSELAVTDQFGKVVIKKAIPVNAGSNFYNLDVSKLSNGIYYVKLSNIAGPQKLVIIR